ncbi:MAG: polysaccharide deacetylase family protein [Candidatus Omnitrophota bacterium]
MTDKIRLGLRIDVDTFRGTKQGVPALCDLLAEHKVLGSFFFSVGPDNMGRHILRLLNPRFLIKMLRTNAARLYGWEILFRGLFFPGPLIGKKCSQEIRGTAAQGHEIGLHAWDHHAWQAHIENMDNARIRAVLKKAYEQIEKIIGKPAVCSAAPAWQSTDKVLEEKLHFPFRYNSDCRGESMFYPKINGKPLSQPQIPVTLPTYDEVIGSNNISDINYNQHVLSLIKPKQLNVLTIHAEVEGIAYLEMFAEFIRLAKQQNILIMPLGDLLDGKLPIEQGYIIKSRIKGRQGWLCLQSKQETNDQQNN